MRAAACVALMLSLAACVQAPPAAVPQPFYANGPLQGQLRDGLFRDKRDWFEVRTPLAPGAPGYAQLSVSEDYVANVSYVGFAPLTAPGEYYRVYMEDFYASNHPVPSLDQVADSAVKVFGSQMVKQRIEPLRLVEEKPWSAAATTGLLRLYTEKVPTELLMQDLGMAEDYTAYILMYVTAQKGKVGVVWAEWPVDCKPCAPVLPGPTAPDDDPIDKALAANGRSKPFMDSFHYHVD